MADNYVTLTTGSKMQTYVNTIASNAVDAEAVVLVDETGNVHGTFNPLSVSIDAYAIAGLPVQTISDVTITDGGQSITVDGTVTATIAPGTDTIAKQEDSVAGNADTGVPAIAIRKATPVNTSDTDGDYEMLQMSAGRLWVDASGKTLNTSASQNGDWIVRSTNATNFLATVSGTVTANQGNASNFLASIVGNVTANQSNASNLLVTASQGGTWNIGTITALPANASFNETQVLGTTIDVNAGNASAGTQRVVLATNQPNVPVTDAGGSLTVDGSVSLTANSSFNLNQVLGTTVDVNSGTKSAGTQRVVIATDQPALTNKLLVTPDANSSFNLSQILATTISTAAAGIQKVGVVGSTGTALTESVSGVRDDMPRKRDGSTGLSPNYYTGRITTKTTTTVTAATAYVSVMKVLCTNAGTAATLNINDTNRTFFSFNIPGGNMTVGGNYEAYTEPIKFTTGINIVTGGTTMGDCNVAITYWQ